MQYLLMIYNDEAAEARRDPADRQRDIELYREFTSEVRDKKVYAGGNPLHPTTTATTVRVRNGKTLAADGPFAETKEQLAGYYLLDCANLDEAIEWAAKIPHAKRGSIEIRPILAVGNTATA